MLILNILLNYNLNKMVEINPCPLKCGYEFKYYSKFAKEKIPDIEYHISNICKKAKKFNLSNYGICVFRGIHLVRNEKSQDHCESCRKQNEEIVSN